MGRWFGGVGLLLLALFMLVGFLRADVDASAPATLVAVLIGVGLPAAPARRRDASGCVAGSSHSGQRSRSC